MNNGFLYDIIYALAAKDGREQVLFGNCSEGAREALSRSLAVERFPELWFEVPLKGDPWFDLHALTAREDMGPGMPLDPATCGGYPEVFRWFARSKSGRQLALSWDVGSGSIEHPAVQLLMSTKDMQEACEFLSAAGRSDAVGSYRSFVERIPQGWFACYAGVFPARAGHNLRVECIPDRSLQLAYREDASLLERNLRQAGFDALGDTVVNRCQLLADAPFQLEFQFDVKEDGVPSSTFSASSRFASPADTGAWKPFAVDGEAGDLMSKVEEWGLADSRWRELAGTIFATRIARGSESAVVYCYPAFLKLRWREGEPLDAKSYLIAGVQ